MTQQGLIEALHKDRISAYIRLRGGFPLPLAGGVYWLTLGILGYFFSYPQWLMIAFFGSGMIFPLGLLFAKIFGNNFMKDKHAAGSVVMPALVGMLLFWPMLVASMKTEPQLAVLILAIGMSMHWPVIGWAYGRTVLYSTHCALRALSVFGIWTFIPNGRITILPIAVAIIYFLTVFAIFVDSTRLGNALKKLS